MNDKTDQRDFHDFSGVGIIMIGMIIGAVTGTVHSCVKHARQIEGLMRMLGAHTHAVKAPDGVECANCINEAKAKGETS